MQFWQSIPFTHPDDMLELAPVAEEADETPPKVRVRQSIGVTKEGGGYRVEDERTVAFAEMMPLGVDEGVEELWRRFGHWGVKSALRKAGARPGDKVLIGSAELEMRE